MNKFIKVALVGAVLATLTACTGFLKSLAVAVLLHSKSLTEIG